MRKASIFVMSAVLAVSLIACSPGTADTKSGEATAPSSSSAGESLKTPATDGKEAAAEESAMTAKPKETTSPAAPAQSETAADTKANGEKQQVSSQSNGSSGKTQSSQTSQPPASTPAQQSESPKPEPPPTPAPAPTEPVKPKTAYEAPYDTAAIIADARAYGESIGMTWSGSLAPDNCSWEAPGATSPTLSGERLKSAMESSIRRIKKLQQDNGYQPGEFHFKVHFVPNGDGEYTIYFLMG